MAEYLIQSGTLGAIADAIRAKKGTAGTMTPAQMATAISGISTKEVLSWHQCPEIVRSYLAAAQAAYPNDPNVTVIDQYAVKRALGVPAEHTKPVPYSVDGVTYTDNVPNVVTPFATPSEAGTLTALDRLRWINTHHAEPAAGSQHQRGYNCRDLGGWACDGGTIRYGMLVRGSEPNPADKELMVDRIGVKTEVQLLPVSEQATDYKMKSPWGIDWAGNDTNETFYGLEKPHLWKKVLEAIMDSVIHSKGVYFHCGIGADRTGVVAMALEGILGVSSADTDIDFELTNFATGWQSLEAGIYRSRTYETFVALKNTINNVPLASGLSDSYRNRWISFVLSCGISIGKINAFRAACIDGTPETITISDYSITANLERCTIDNPAVYIQPREPYHATLTATEGDLSAATVTVTMGGNDVTAIVYSAGVIDIAEATGNIVISASVPIPKIVVFNEPTTKIYDNKRWRNIKEMGDDSGQCIVCFDIPAKSSFRLTVRGNYWFGNVNPGGYIAPSAVNDSPYEELPTTDPENITNKTQGYATSYTFYNPNLYTRIGLAFIVAGTAQIPGSNMSGYAVGTLEIEIEK